MGKKYYLHKSLLVFHSEYFRKALQGSWKEAKEGIVRIDDIEPAECTFKIFTLQSRAWLTNRSQYLCSLALYSAFSL